MPIMNGYEATKKLIQGMEKGTIRSVPIIGTSAYSSEDEILQCRDCGMSEAIRKPITFDILKTKLKEYGII